MIQDYIELVVKTLLHRRIRSWLTIIGVVIGVAAILSLVTLGEGMKNGIEEQFEKLGISNIRVIPGGNNGPPNPSRTLPNSILDRIEAVRGVDYVDPVTINRAIVEYDNTERLVSILGYDTSLGSKGFVDLDTDLQAGRFFTAADKNSVLIGHDFAKDAFEKELFTKNNILIDDQKFRVIGIFEETGTDIDGNVYIPLDTSRDLFDQQDTINGAVVHLLRGIDIDEAAESITRNLERDLDEDEFDLFTPDQILEQINAILGIVQTVVGGIAAISLIVGAVGIMNAMFTSVLERTNQIGLMKAVGATNADVLLIFILESGIIGLVGGVLGVVIGTAMAYGMAFAINASGFVPVVIQINPQVVAISLAFAFFVGIISGTVPALQAAKLKPVDALRYE